MQDFLKLFIFIGLQAFICNGQRVAPGVPPQHYQNTQQQYHVPVQQQVPHHVQQNIHQVPNMQQVPIQAQQQVPVQYQQQQVPVQPVHGHNHGGQPQILNAANIAHEKGHIQEHLEVPIDTSKMSEQELQFHYFKLHDSDNNNKLDGCELIKSLIHWHDQGKAKQESGVEEKIFKDEELTTLIDPILSVDDLNRDGFIDYPEFIRAQQKAAQNPKN